MDPLGISQLQIDDTTNDRRHLIEARQTIFRLEAENKHYKTVVKEQLETLDNLKKELEKVKSQLTNITK